jgi:hypothetical protein
MERRNISFFRLDRTRHASYIEAVQEIIDVGQAEIQESHPDWVPPRLAVTAALSRDARR